MATTKQTKAAKQNIKKAQQKWRNMPKSIRSRSQPEGRARAKPGAKGTGDYYRVVVRDKEQFTSFRNHDVGERGRIQRLAGRRSSGSWSTQAWLIGKDEAHEKNGKLVADSRDARDVLKQIGSEPTHRKGDVFKAKPRPNVPEKDKPTPAQRKARKQNIKKAQAARWSK